MVPYCKVLYSYSVFIFHDTEIVCLEYRQFSAKLPLTLKIIKFTISNLFLWQSNGMQPDLLEDENPEMNEMGEDAHLLSSN